MADLLTDAQLETCQNMVTTDVAVYDEHTGRFKKWIQVTEKCGNTLFTPDERMASVCAACQGKQLRGEA